MDEACRAASDREEMKVELSMLTRQSSILRMSAIAMELEQVLLGLGAEGARRLEGKVRGVISEAAREAKEWKEVMALVRQDKPYLAECIGAFSDIDFQRPDQGELPPIRL